MKIEALQITITPYDMQSDEYFEIRFDVKGWMPTYKDFHVSHVVKKSDMESRLEIIFREAYNAVKSLAEKGEME